jgi:two-component system, OmpR family, sensor histidine kinase PrrB
MASHACCTRCAGSASCCEPDAVRSLRSRLTVDVLIVLAVVLAAGGLVASHDVSSSERAAFDDRLERTAELSRATALASVQQQIPTDDRRLDAVLSATGSSLRLLLGRVVLLDTGAKPPAHARLTKGLQTFRSGGVDYRSYVTSLRDRNLGGLARLEVISSLAALERRQSELNRRLAALGLLGLALAGLGVWLAANVVLRPLTRLRAVASSIADDEDLDRRVPPDDGPAELGSLAASFNAMLARLGSSSADRQRALNATQRFAADAGHELRTPLTSVQATLSTLRRHTDLPADRRVEMLDDALSEQRRLVELLDGLQALARGDAAQVVHTDVDLADVVDAVVTSAADHHPASTITARLPDTPVILSGWEPGLRLLVENLVSNAARHGKPGGSVLVTLEPASRDAGLAGPALHVDDDGPGIPDEERDRIFEPFVRVAGTEQAGSGLGLALVAQQARQHGTGVDVSTGPLGGARFSVRFPA